ncbi:MAG: amidohydrolase family protein [Verrucomicrobiales bacterium]|nr:amidohydrolase family protein [Verrucomicrobiales bacterium]
MSGFRFAALWFPLFLAAPLAAQDVPLPPKDDFHLFLLVGQSNMAGRGEVTPADQEPDPRILMFDREGRWVPAVDPMHWDKPSAGVGLGRSFARAVAQARPGVTIGLIPCAAGGSPIDTWKPGALHDQTQSHPWDDTIRRAAAALPAGTLKGILWHQGESDCRPALAPAYEAKLLDLVGRFRSELKASRVPFLVGQMGKFPDVPWTPEIETVDAVHRRLPGQVPLCGFVSAEGLAHKGDKIHFDSPSYRELGRRYAAAYLRLDGIVDAGPPDAVYLKGKIITLDPSESIAEALAVKDGRIIAVGSNAAIDALGSPTTQRIDLGGRTVVPGFVESHCHSLGAARAALDGDYAEVRSIAELQDWIRRRAAQVPPGTWIETPRNEITRLIEQRFPTPEELDAATTTHPVVFISVTKTVLNSPGWKALGLDQPDATIPDGEVLRENGRPVLMRGGQASLRKHMPAPKVHPIDAVLAKHAELVGVYNSVGITTIFERATDRSGFDTFRELAAKGDLNVRVRGTFRFSAKDAAGVDAYLAKLGLSPGDGDDRVRATCLKITVDGGIHWGTTWLSEPHGEKRTAFYRNADPAYTGTQSYTPAQMEAIFGAANAKGWPMSAHVTGDGGAMAVLRAVEAVARTQPDIRERRFNLIHCYFPTPEMAALAKSLNAGVDTQGYLYERDADFIARIYGPDWAERFMGLGEWVKAGVPVGLNSDHMIGFDPDRAMNAFRPALMLDIAVNRRDDRGRVHGAHQQLSRLDALRTLTIWPAWLSFDEEKLGTLEPGKLADFAVLDRDYLECPAEEIRRIGVEMTVLGGEVVYSR